MSTKRKLCTDSSTPSKRHRKCLTLAEKVEVIRYCEAGHSNRSAADKFAIGRTQVNNIILQKERVLHDFNDGKNTSTKYLATRALLYPEIDAEVWQFFLEARSKNIPVSGHNLLSTAEESAMKHNYTSFNASNGWLQRFITRHNIRMSSLHGESAEVSQEVVDNWKQNLPELCHGYSDRDIYNVDETAIFFRMLPNKSYIQTTEQRSGVKVLKDRYTVVVCANLAGEKEKLTIIGKSKNPHSFPRKRSTRCKNFRY